MLTSNVLVQLKFTSALSKLPQLTDDWLIKIVFSC